MALDQLKHRDRDSGADAEQDAALQRVVKVIVTEFNGDTSALFDSIRQATSAQDQKDDAREACIALKFAKSV